MSVPLEVNDTFCVLESDEDDVYKDMVRVHEEFRKVGDQLLPEGSLCRVTCNQRAIYLVVRGGGKHPPKRAIWMDERTRTRLNITLRKEYRFTLRRSGVWGGFWSAIRSSDMSYRIMAVLGLVSVVLGVAGCVLGILGFVGK
jgi:hypothetical protein